MRIRRLLLAFILPLALASNVLYAQVLEPVKWSFSHEKISEKEFKLIFTATIENKWHLYSQNIQEGGPVPTSFRFDPSSDFQLVGKVEEPRPKRMYDPNFEMEVAYFDHKAVFTQKVKALVDRPFKVKGALEFMCCDDSRCLPPNEVEFEFTLTPGAGAASEVVSTTTATSSTDTGKGSSLVEPLQIKTSQTAAEEVTATEGTDSNSTSSLWLFFWVAFLGGLLAILTPCVFPMIPMTVSFFMHDETNKAKARFQAIFYGFSIIAIYTIIGTVVALTLGANFANFLSTHWLPNLFFFLIFMVFAASFFGAFEIVLPSWLVTKTDQKADKGGLVGAFFMAFTLVLVSFSCTAPIVGSILVASASGEILKPIVGMLGFGLAFALPFTLFALFPGWLSNLPKSGGWLNSVKVVLGFIEVALGLKFLSVADQTYHWGILDREIYIAIWIVVFTLMGFYLLGKIRFKHDSEVTHIGVFRLTLVIITFSFVVYLIPGMWGAPLKALAGYLPPQSSHDFDLNQVIRDNAKLIMESGKTASFPGTTNETCDKPKYSEFLHLPHGLEGYFDYEQGLACAKKLNKPVFIDFTGHGCVNCREMEARVWSHPEVLKRLKNDFVIIALYVDDKTELPENEWIVSSYDGKVKKTIGKKYADFQISRFNVNAQPYYVLLDPDGNQLVPPKAYDLNVDNFIRFLDSGLEAFRKRQQ
ncbi:MAG: thioredoxin fold domain-containing protein [Bacteroidales bacterium]|jgi:thiol:disulfide interchange protein DsbD|nr:thioredoxin fold domain-containing protein [Bacteroidales bacterium]